MTQVLLNINTFNLTVVIAGLCRLDYAKEICFAQILLHFFSLLQVQMPESNCSAFWSELVTILKSSADP